MQLLKSLLKVFHVKPMPPIPKTVPTTDITKCGLCGSRDVFHGGSWAPECCNTCKAVYFAGNWIELNPEDRERMCSSYN